jgi:hypothetical protein
MVYVNFKMFITRKNKMRKTLEKTPVSNAVDTMVEDTQQEQIEQSQHNNNEMLNKLIDLTLKVSEINTILAALDEIPHKFSRGIIDQIRTQATAQLPSNS